MVRSFIALSLVVLASCAKSEKEFQPVIAKIGDTVKAISNEEAETICKTNFCEQNQIYTASFGRRKPRPAPEPVPTPTQTPDPLPSQPPVGPQPKEVLDYSRALLNLKDAWLMTEGSPEVVVAVIDSGVEYTHPDLKDNIWKNAKELNGQPGKDDDGNGYVDDVYGWDFYNDRPNGYDDNGHGTHCAGIIAAAKNNFGTRGVAPNVKIMPLKFLGRNGSGDTADAIRAVDYAVANGARILSNSWGGGGYSSLLGQAVDRANDAGLIFVAAAGNESNDNDSFARYPANYEGVFAVGSSDSQDRKSSFSNYGAEAVFIFAPGSNIYSTYVGATYDTLSGTSMAAPQVSGGFALGASLRPSATKSELSDALCKSTVQKLTSYSQCGRMDIAAFLRRL